MSDLLPPSHLFGTLFEAVQQNAVFADSKTFADAVPLRAPHRIVADWESSHDLDGGQLREFVQKNFELPSEREEVPTGAGDLSQYIAELWPHLTREPIMPQSGASSLALPHKHVVPGGRFRELYYWDSYFTMLGIARSGRQDLVEEMIAAFGYLLDCHGMIPNGTRTYYLSRSHPPVFYLMTTLSRRQSPEDRAERLRWMRIEHRFWMDGSSDLTCGESHRRVVRLQDGALLNRYWDDRAEPRDESWREDVALAELKNEGDREQLWRDLRAAAESGWDFSSRWLADPSDLGTIRTTRLLPVDLNCLLLGLEQSIAKEAKALGNFVLAEDYRSRAEMRLRAIKRHLWNEPGGFFADFDLDRDSVNGRLTAATAFTLFTGIASPAEAARIKAALLSLQGDGGIKTTPIYSVQQWDAPNGWAPLQWIAIRGLAAYGYNEVAGIIAESWVRMVEGHFDQTGLLVEKYDVDARLGGSGGEYPPVIGFGWTNGVTLTLLEDWCGALTTPQLATQ